MLYLSLAGLFIILVVVVAAVVASVDSVAAVVCVLSPLQFFARNEEIFYMYNDENLDDDDLNKFVVVFLETMSV